MLTQSQISKYLNRILFSGKPGNDKQTLFRLQRQHLLSIPFENLDIHCGVPINLNVNSFFRKVVEMNRGGFCYELNGLFSDLLMSLGFDVSLLSARVSTGDGGFGKDFDHLCIAVKLGSEIYLTDVGFGEFTFAPLKIMTEIKQKDERGLFAIFEYERDQFLVVKESDNANKDQYVFSFIPRELKDFEGMCRYHQTSPDSHFTQKKICSIPVEGGRKSLSDSTYKVTMGAEITETPVTSENDFNSILQKEFGIRL